MSKTNKKEQDNETSKASYGFMLEEKKKGIKVIDVPFFFKKTIEMNGTYINDYYAEELALETNLKDMTSDTMKVLLGIFTEINEKKYEYEKYLKDKYGKEINVLQLILNKREITLSYEEMCRYMGKKYTRRNKYKLVNKIDEIADGFFNFNAKVNGKKVKCSIHLCNYVVNDESRNVLAISLSDFLIFSALNESVRIQLTKKILSARNIGLINLGIYLVSFRYNDRQRIMYNQNNVVGIRTIFDKYYMCFDNKEEKMDNLKKMSKSNFMLTLKRIITSVLKSYDDDATFKIDTKGYRNIGQIIDRGVVEINLPVFNERVEYNKMRNKVIENSEHDEHSNSEELPFEK